MVSSQEAPQSDARVGAGDSLRTVFSTSIAHQRACIGGGPMASQHLHYSAALSWMQLGEQVGWCLCVSSFAHTFLPHPPILLNFFGFAFGFCFSCTICMCGAGYPEGVSKLHTPEDVKSALHTIRCAKSRDCLRRRALHAAILAGPRAAAAELAKSTCQLLWARDSKGAV